MLYISFNICYERMFEHGKSGRLQVQITILDLFLANYKIIISVIGQILTKAFLLLISFSGACYYLSSTINPFLYSLLSVRFRRGFQDVLRRCSGRMPVGIGLVQGTIQDFFVRVSSDEPGREFSGSSRAKLGHFNFELKPS